MEAGLEPSVIRPFLHTIFHLFLDPWSKLMMLAKKHCVNGPVSGAIVQPHPTAIIKRRIWVQDVVLQPGQKMHELWRVCPSVCPCLPGSYMICMMYHLVSQQIQQMWRKAIMVDMSININLEAVVIQAATCVFGIVMWCILHCWVSMQIAHEKSAHHHEESEE